MATQRGYRISRTETPEMRAREITVRILGLPKEHDPEVVIRAVGKGFASASVSRLAEYMRVPEGDVLEAVDISRSTFSRRKKAKRLTTEESDRVYRLTRLLGRAVAVLGDEAEARQWMQAPKRALGNVSPLIMARTDAGVQEVEDLLGRIEFGIPS
jgi:putative toxin-antitoxin system antitoxin component (TIGR02293 family)